MIARGSDLVRFCDELLARVKGARVRSAVAQARTSAQWGRTREAIDLLVRLGHPDAARLAPVGGAS